MRSRALRVAMLVFQAVWLNAILPGHTRGIVTLPGGPDDCTSCLPAPTTAAGDCCPADDPAADHTPRGKAPVAPGRAGRCAVCHFAARLTVPPVIDLRPPALQLAAVASVLPSPRCVSLRFPPPYDACGPPPADASFALP